MISQRSLLAFLPVAALVVAVPGPSVLFTIGRALSAGRRAALLTVLGNGVGLLLQGLMVAVGLGALLTTVTGALLALKVLGGGYLIWLGIQAIRHRGESAEADGPPDAASASASARRADLRAGLVLGLTNPKSLVFLGALLPQFVTADAHPVTQMLILGAIFAGIAVLGDSIWAVAAARARGWFAHSPGALPTVRGAGGVLLIGLGAWTLVSGQRTA